MDLLSQHEAFLRAIFDNPEDDTARLVYADFLQENGEEVKAELIRVQCQYSELRALAEHTDRAWYLGVELEARQHELIWRLESSLQPWPAAESKIAKLGHARGFRAEGAKFIVTATTLANTPEERMRVVRSVPEAFGARALSFDGSIRLNPEDIELLFTLPMLQHTTDWSLFYSATAAAVKALTTHESTQRITELDLRSNDLENDTAQALIASPFLENLKRLVLFHGNNVGNEMRRLVIERFGDKVR